MFSSPVLWIKLTRTMLEKPFRRVPKRTTNKKRTCVYYIYIWNNMFKKRMFKKKASLCWLQKRHTTADGISMARSSTFSRYNMLSILNNVMYLICYILFFLGLVGVDRATFHIPSRISPFSPGSVFRQGAARISPSCGVTDSARSVATQHWESAYVLGAGRSSGGPRC